ncbi:MAG TPA: PQQ-binding-like beta-propeller repeat protein [Planctomycetota bacterium]
MLRLALALAPLVAPNSGESWGRFRGPDGAGLAPDGARLPDALDPAKNLRWSAELPPGNSSPCLATTRAFVTGCTDAELVTVCLDRADGEILWERALPVATLEKTQEQNSPATPTPTTDGERVIAYFGSFGLVAYDLAGDELWRRALPVPKNTFGTAASPVIAGGKLVFVSDANEGSFLEALDPATGRTLWKVDRARFQSGWSTPGLWSRDGKDELLVLGVGWLSAYDLADGAERWSFPGLTDEPITTPIAGAGLVFATSYNLRTNEDAMLLWSYAKVLEEHDADGDGSIDRAELKTNASVLSRPDADGEGDHPLSIFERFLDVDRDGRITAKEYEKLEGWVNSWEHLNGIVALRPGTAERPAELAWHFPRGVPECPSPLYLDGRVYMVMNGGTVTCLEAASGKLLYQERLAARGPYYASLVGGDGKVYAASARGEVTVLAAGSELKVLSSVDLAERLMATPALADGTVYVRTETRLRAFARAE